MYACFYHTIAKLYIPTHFMCMYFVCTNKYYHEIINLNSFSILL